VKRFLNSSVLMLLVLLLSSCAGIPVEYPDTEICAVAGVMRAGMDCSNTLATEETTNEKGEKVLVAKTREMNEAEMIDFLEPQPARPDPLDPKTILPKRGAAVCQASEAFGKYKSALDKMCALLKERCTMEFKQIIKQVEKSLDSIQTPALPL
jgi:hypothetical protein